MDDGHKKLIEDLEAILAEAKDFQFHDFKNKKYAMPKMDLILWLNNLVQRAKSGTYDN